MENLLQEARAIQDYLEISCSGDINELIDRLSNLNVYMARSGEMLAQAIKLQDNALNAVYAEQLNLILKMPATVATKFTSSCCAAQNHLVKWLERINATCKHQSDNIRTQISFEKERLRLERSGY